MTLSQARPFEQRLNDFGPELGMFLGKVWKLRTSINLNDFGTGVNSIYGLYSGAATTRAYSEAELVKFIKDLRAAAGNYPIDPQGFKNPLSDFDDIAIKVYGQDLWTDFFHVLSTDNPTKDIRSRVYVHAADWKASLKLMKLIIGQFGKNKGLWEAKTAGPGSQRLDTIVCYLYDGTSADSLVDLLKTTAKTDGALFADSLPPLVKKQAAGIGVADEPPAIEIYKRGGARHSFGSFFSSLCWVALKTTPDVAKPTADGRHMLDNMLYSLRLLRVEPKNPQRFPEASALEAWYRASVR